MKNDFKLGYDITHNLIAYLMNLVIVKKTVKDWTHVNEIKSIINFEITQDNSW